METQNLFTYPKNLKNQEITDLLAEFPSGKIERIVSSGYHSPEGFWYDQEESEWVSVLSGKAELEFEEKIQLLEAGDCLLIPPHHRHRVKWTSSNPPCIWLCVFYQSSKQ